ncbi:Multiple epidermal growth factor-like domains protein 8 [Mortierella sp. AD011]|nr:Multiple epidermal growth factor-like domains protein 8 [Mortierella sp. AD011]
MARQWHPYWARYCLVLFGSFLFLAILQRPNSDKAYSWATHAASTRGLTYGTSRSDIHSQESDMNSPSVLQDIQQHNVEESVYSHSDKAYQRREVRDVIEEGEEESPPVNSWISNSGILSYQLTVASTICDSGSLQMQGPAWNGTFESNSPDGIYPSQNRTCTWTLQAISNATGPDSSGKNVIPYVIAVSFSGPIQLVCGLDYLTLYDGADTTAPVLARLCGNTTPTIYSTGSQLTAVFSSQAESPGSYGFTATWASVDTAGFKDFTPRSQHAMAYDPDKDMVYIMGGTSLRYRYMWDLLTYTFATNKWNKIILNSRSPDPRYGHYAFVYDSDLYIYGGVTGIGGNTEVWKFNGKAWTLLPANLDQIPVGRSGSACAVVTNNSSAKLYVFGGLDPGGVTSRDLNAYDLNTGVWSKFNYQNSVGLSGASAIYHQATDSIYFFGGMVNETTRNVITYQYRIIQDQWYALAPRVDPFTATPVINGNGTLDPSEYFNVTTSDSDDEDGDDIVSSPYTILEYFPPVMYDPLTTVWTPAGLMGYDSVVMYGGMRPFGPGVDENDQACFSKSFSIYDLSCQKWTSFDIADSDSVINSRANHTMALRPPGSPGGSKTAWTAYIFGGFDGVDHADMLNFTLNVVDPTPAVTNNCRALRWCSLYDDCQNCNPSYCSYVKGLCLFDTDKAKNGDYLLGSATDVPRNGTIQSLIRERPDLASHVLTPQNCPARTILNLANPYSETMQPGQEMTFKIYVDAHDLDIQFEIRTLPTSALNFKTLNVWEGFMNMYWRADHGLSDGTWDGVSEVSSPIPPDVATSDNITLRDYPVITATGGLNASELMNRWIKYEGLDGSELLSAKRENSSYIYFPASDPRRFSGNYVFSLTNYNPTALSFSVTVTLLDHPTPVNETTGGSFNMATLGFFMLGFVFAIVLLIFLARKVRQLIEDRDASHRAAEMELLEDEENNRNDGGVICRLGEGMLTKKPIYRIVVGVQDLEKYVSVISGNTLRHRMARADGSSSKSGHSNNDNDNDNDNSRNKSRSCSESSAVPQTTGREEYLVEQNRRPRARSDFIRDIGSTPLPLAIAEGLIASPSEHGSMSVSDLSGTIASTIGSDKAMNPNQAEDARVGCEEDASSQLTDQTLGKDKAKLGQDSDSNSENNVLRLNTQQGGLMRGWSLKSLGRTTSFRRNQSNYSCEEREALTGQESLEEDERASHSGSGFYDSEQEIVDLGALSAQKDLHKIQREQLEKHQGEVEEGVSDINWKRNPIKVQPLSIEPLPFHTGLVPRTGRNFRRYQKYLARRQRRQQLSKSLQDSEPARPDARAAEHGRSRMSNRAHIDNNGIRSTNLCRMGSKNHPTTSMSPSQRLPPKQVRASRSQGSLREVHRVASQMTMRTNPDSLGTKDPKPVRSKSLAVNEASARDRWFESKPEDDLEAGIELKQLVSSMKNTSHGSDGLPESPIVSSQNQQSQQQKENMQDQNPPSESAKRKVIKMRGHQEYEPGPMLAMNYLIVFPGDTGSRRVRQQGDFRRSKKTPVSATMKGQTGVDDNGGDSNAMVSLGPEDENDDTLYNTDLRLPPMAIGTIFVPDPVRWWAYDAKRVLDRQKFERQMKRMQRLKEREMRLQSPQPAKTR